MIQSRKAMYTNTHIVLYLLLLIDLMYNDGQTFQIVKTTSHTHIRNVWQGLARLWIFALIFISPRYSADSLKWLCIYWPFLKPCRTPTGPNDSYEMAAHTMTDPPPCLTPGKRHCGLSYFFILFFYLAVSKQKQAQIEDKGKLSINVTFALFRVFFSYLFVLPLNIVDLLSSTWLQLNKCNVFRKSVLTTFRLSDLSFFFVLFS